MEPVKAELCDSTWRNVHLLSLYKEAEEFDVGPLLRKNITVQSLQKLLSGQEPFVPSWLALDGDTEDPEFWIETLSVVSARSSEYLCADAALFHDSLSQRSQALITRHALNHMYKRLSTNGHGEVCQTPNINGKRPQSGTIGPPFKSPRSANKSPKPPKFPEEPKLKLKKWLQICDGSRTGWGETGWRDTHAEWNHMIQRSKAAKIKSWDNLERSWECQGLTLSLGYFSSMTDKHVRKCSSLISELSKGRSNSDDASGSSYIPIVRGLGDLWPAAKNAEFESCIRDVIYGNFKQRTEQLLGYLLELARIIKESTITVCRRNARQLQQEQKETEMKNREERCRRAEEDFGRDRLALDDERASMDMARAKLRETQELFDEKVLALGTVATDFEEREGDLAERELSCKEKEDALTAKEASCTERGAHTANAAAELQTKLEAYENNQRLLVEGQREANEGKKRHAKNMVTIARRDAASISKEKELKEREAKLEAQEKRVKEKEEKADAQEKSANDLRAWVDNRWTATLDRERLCTSKEVGFDEREAALRKEKEASRKEKEALRKEKAAVSSDRKDLGTKISTLKQEQAEVASRRQKIETQTSDLKREQARHKEAKVALEAREENLSKEQAALVSEKKGLNAEKAVFRQDVAARREGEKKLKADSEELAQERERIAYVKKHYTAAKKELECEKTEVKALKVALSNKHNEVAATKKALEDEKAALKADRDTVSRKLTSAAAARKALEDEKSALKATKSAISRENEEMKASQEALESERSKLRGKEAQFEKEKTALREKMRVSMQHMQEMQKTMCI
ncbi:hypothetical protein V494_06186 [Pseudogymnoascus sp. VKM F-4513 (FW-928)]|nr:hypothetical protein V494_06186 [Pseudogymnoascus sp. VKM F-4513 (FW-928)]